MSGYPSFDDYEAAVRMPNQFFSDPEIARRVPVIDRLGSPVFISGAFAVTFKFARPDGSDPIAVRCFKSEIADLVDRYRKIDRFLSELRSDLFVNFAVSAPETSAGKTRGGVLIRGRWLPVMRMDWVSGASFGEAISQAVKRRDSAALGAFRDQILAYAQLCELRGFAHGDIHPENIIVQDGKMKFVDYDGMFVPGLSGVTSVLAGQEDFQSPLRMREPAIFGPWLDRFSLLVFDLSLAALQRNPDIIALRTPGEGILLGRADYVAPGQSRLLDEIARLPGLAGPAEILRQACGHRLDRLPPLSVSRTAEAAWRPPGLVRRLIFDRVLPNLHRLRSNAVPALLRHLRYYVTRADRVRFAPAMLLLTVAYLTCELAFNARLLDVVGTRVTPSEIMAIEQWGRLISGAALTLAVWGSLIFPATRRLKFGSEWRLLLLAATAGICIFATYAAENALVDRIVAATDPRDMRTAVILQAQREIYLRTRPFPSPQLKAVTALWPWMAVGDRSWQASAARQAAGVSDTQARAAMKALVVPPIALGFSMLGAIVHILKAANFALLTFFPGFGGRRFILVPLAASLLIWPLALKNNITLNRDWATLIGQTGERNGLPAAVAIRWIVQAQPYVYPVTDRIRRDIFLGASFNTTFGDVCAATMATAANFDRAHDFSFKVRDALLWLSPDHC